jgi:mono/diheme cytochrome c family protein
MRPDKKILLFFLAGSVLVFTLCVHDAVMTDMPEVCFTGQVLPVFLNNCAITGCHDGSGEEAMALSSYSDISMYVRPGNANASPIYRSITSKWGQQMPPRQPLSIENRTLIRVWIEQGASETTCADTSSGNNGNTNPADKYVARACFSRDILPVIISHCATAGCHDAASHEEGYNLTSYNNVMRAVNAGSPTTSRLYRVITVAGGEEKMPPAGNPQLSAAEIDSIRKWISYGALNETCGEVCDTVNPVTFSGTIWPLMKTNCVGCHSGTNPSGNILLASYSNVSSVAASGMLLKALTGSGVTRMPPGAALSSCRIRQFEIWIKNGFPNN